MTALILHGGAGARRERNYDREVGHMREVVEAMKGRLDAGASALDVAVETVTMLEDSGLYVAGRGASPNLAGAFELDASLMDGAPSPASMTCGVWSMTARAATIGLRKPCRAATAPALRVAPSIRLASSSKAPARLGEAPRPAT